VPCSLAPCSREAKMELQYTGGPKQPFCSEAHLLAFMLQKFGSAASSVIAQAVLHCQTPKGRKELVSYLLDKVL